MYPAAPYLQPFPHQIPASVFLTTIYLNIRFTGLQCEALSKQLGSRVALLGSHEYSNTVSSYWSLKEVEVRPKCIVLPQSAEEVSMAVRTLAAGLELFSDSCRFAIRGGG